MKFVGRDSVRTYTDADSLRFDPGPAPRWQDSTWLQWWDLEHAVGGVHRIGHQYNIDGGPMVAGWTNLVTPAGIYKHVTYLPLRDEDKLANGWGSGDDCARNEIVDGEHIWTIEDPGAGVSARLSFTDYHGAFNGFPGSGQTAEDLVPDHIDISGPVSGSITIKGKTFPVSGMGMRDHGWGRRDVLTMHSHRYVTGCFGPELSFCAYAFHMYEEVITTFAWVVRHDVVTFASDVDILAYAEVDSFSTRGGRVRLQLADGSELDCELEAVAPGLVNTLGDTGFYNNNTLCRVTSDDQVGTGHFESSMNFFQGTRQGQRMQRALLGNGLYPGTPAEMRAQADNPFLPIRTV